MALQHGGLSHPGGGIGTLSLVHPFQATKSGPDPGYVSSSIDLLPMLSATLQVSTDYLLMGKSIDKEMTRTQLLSVISQLTLITQGL